MIENSVFSSSKEGKTLFFLIQHSPISVGIPYTVFLQERGVTLMENWEQVDFGKMCLDQLPLAMSYVPRQRWEDLYAPSVALERGTLFAKLDLPFIGKEAVQNGR